MSIVDELQERVDYGHLGVTSGVINRAIVHITALESRAQAAEARAEAAELKAKRNYGEAFDKHYGTPCEQIRHAQEKEDLKARIDQSRAEGEIAGLMAASEIAIGIFGPDWSGMYRSAAETIQTKILSEASAAEAKLNSAEALK